MSSTYSYSVVRDEDGDRNISIFIPKRTTPPIREDHPNWDDIFQHVVVNNDPDVEALIKLLDIAAQAALQFNSLSDRVSIKDGRVYIDHDEIDNRLTRQIVRFMKEGIEDYQSLVNFFEKAAQNPNPHSREMLGDWLANHDFTITTDGDIVGYKGCRVSNKEGVEYESTTAGPAIVDGKEHKSGFVPNNIGSTIEVPRSYVQANPSVGCSTGLHIGTYGFAQSYGTVLQVHVNPRDVVSVPTECSAQKMRCCRYTVIGTVEGKITDAVIKLEDDTGPLNDALLPSDKSDSEAGQFQTDMGCCEMCDAEEEGYCDCGLTLEECDEREDCPDGSSGPETDVSHPSDIEFFNMQSRAKTRRQNFVKYATKMGPWTLVGDDPTDATSWSVPQDS